MFQKLCLCIQVEFVNLTLRENKFWNRTAISSIVEFSLDSWQCEGNFPLLWRHERKTELLAVVCSQTRKVMASCAARWTQLEGGISSHWQHVSPQTYPTCNARFDVVHLTSCTTRDDGRHLSHNVAPFYPTQWRIPLLQHQSRKIQEDPLLPVIVHIKGRCPTHYVNRGIFEPWSKPFACSPARI